VELEFKPRALAKVTARKGGKGIEFNAIVRIDTPVEVEYLRNGGILQTVLRKLTA
jgi:aconitate hydratase